MKTILRDKNQYVLRLDRGEELIESLGRFCRKEKIGGGFFSGLGACSYLDLAFYDLRNKKYLSKKINRPFEILTIGGNLSRFESKLIIHAHGIFADEKMQTCGGHINSLVVSATCEIFFIKLKRRIERKHSKEIGLNLMNR